MARRAVIDREELFETANAMAADGKDVTALALLNALRGGSLTTIYKYLSEWETGRPKTAPAAGSTDIPDVVQNAFAGTWRVAAMEAARETAAAKEKAAEEVKAAHKKFEEALEGIQRLEVQGEQDASQIEILQGKVSELEDQLSQAKRDNAGLKAAGEQLRHQVKSQEAELERLHKGMEDQRKGHHDELTRLQAEHSAAQQKANADVERLQGQVSDAQARAEQSERDRTLAHSKLDQAVKQITETSQRLQAAEQKQETSSKEREAAIKEAAELKGQAQALKAQNTELVARLSERTPKKTKQEE